MKIRIQHRLDKQGSQKKEKCPGKNMRRNPAIPTWDPRRIPGGIPPFSGGIPTGIMEDPVWDPTRDYGTFCVVSHPGLWNIPCGIPHGIPPQISDSFPPGKSYCRRDCKSQFGLCLKLQMASNLTF